MEEDGNTKGGGPEHRGGQTENDSGAFEATHVAAGRAKPTGDLDAIEPGSTIGRFVVEEVLGQGGMGVVVSARDPNLERKVAIKLLRPDSYGGQGSEVGSTRLRREAQAMARLSHPNVVVVHEVGTIGDRVFVAMEYVEGGTLRDWCEREPRSTGEILEVFAAAARGLAAAHDAGLVHRDFKPENVLVGRDGRVLVTDFGIVGIAGAEVAEPARGLEGSSAQLPSSTPLDGSLTQTGVLLGTPLYMAPEQHRGGAIGPAADQFAFCVALFEALFGERPFAGESYPELESNVSSGNLREPSEKEAAHVPAHVRRALRRGLRPNPADRYPSMARLHADLHREERSHSRSRPLLVATGFVGLAIAGLAALALWRGSGSDRAKLCESAPQELAGVWDAERRTAVREAFAGTERPYSEDTFRRVADLLDERARAWTEMYRAACRATHIEGRQSDEILDLRMHCLRTRLGELSAAVDLLSEQPDPRVLDQAVEVASGLAPLDLCADTEALRAAVPLPASEHDRARVAELRRRLQAADAVLQAGAYERSYELASDVLAEARELGYPPLLAQALFQFGDAQSRTGREKEAEDTLTEAARLAAEARDDQVAAKAWTALVYTVGYRQSRHARALALVPAARAAIDRAGGTRLLTRFMLVHGALLNATGEYREGQQVLEDALRILESREDTLPADIADYLNSIGGSLSAQGKYAEARDYLERGLEMRRQALGPRHPRVASSLVNLATTIAERGDIDRAREHYEEAIAILSDALGPEHPHVATALNNLGADLCGHGRCVHAREYLERALAIRSAAFGPDSPHVATTLNNLGESFVSVGDYDAAREPLERALAVREKTLGPEHPRVGSTLAALGNMLRGKGRIEEARARYERALAIWEKALGPTHPRVASALAGIGECHLEEGRAAKAIEYLERAVKLGEENQADPVPVAEARFALARALWDARRDRHRARTLAELAGDAFAEAGERAAADHRRVADWLAARR